MAHPRLRTMLLTAATLLAVAPAYAQFGSIFRDEPPRPPGDVPSAPPSNYPPPSQQQQRNFPNQRPPAELRPDQPPAQPLPAPMSLPPSSRPGGGSIQSQPLAPPPGVPVAPQPSGAAGPVQALPGLPPGVRQPHGAPPQPVNTAPQPGDEIVVEPPPQRITNPTAVFAGLDKITGRIISL